MPIVLLLLAHSLAGPATANLVAKARARTVADVPCVSADATDVTVCARRDADRYRAPLATHVGDRRDDVVAQRAALLRRTTPVQDLSPFLVGGGMAGASVGTTFGSEGGRTHVRPLAP